MTSPTLAYRRFEPPKTLMHISRRAPLLSAAFNIDCICIIFDHQSTLRPLFN
jgi:hypothetical protein